MGGHMGSTETEIPSEMDALLKSLLEQKSAILNKSSEFRKEQLARAPIGDEAEIASENVDESISLQLYERDRKTLLQIERALGKIADGTYGQCESCEAPVGQRRLQAHPFSTLCVSCMEEQENRPLLQ